VRLKLTAAIVGLGALAIAAVALTVAIVRPGGGTSSHATPIPTASLDGRWVAEEFTSTSFAVPLRLPLPRTGSPEGWRVGESSSIVKFSPNLTTPSAMYLLAASATRVVDMDGRPSALPDDLAAWLNDQAGITAGTYPPGDEQQRWQIAGREVGVYLATITPDAADAGRPLLQTTDGHAVLMPEVPMAWWLARIGGDDEELVLIFSRPADFALQNWNGAFLDMTFSLELL